MKGTGVRIEGGLLAAEVLERIVRGEEAGQKPEDFGLGAGVRIADHLLAQWTYAKRLWGAFAALREMAEPERATTLTRERWLIPLLTDVLGYAVTYQRTAAETGGQRYAISHRADPDEEAPPVHLVGWTADLDRRNDELRERRSPQALMQDYLNRSDHLWGVLSNGERLRLVRQNPRISRPAYVEFDLEAIFGGDRFDDFVLLYRLAHRSRLPRPGQEAAACWLERYVTASVESTHKVRDRMRDGVERALRILGTGFLSHPDSHALRAAVRSGELTAEDLYQQLLRLVYRCIFLMVAEDRQLLLVNPTGRAAQIYQDYYSLKRLREQAMHYRWADRRHKDVWLGLVTLFRTLAEPRKDHPLGLYPLNGDLFGPGALPDLERASISNQDLLEAIWHLSTFDDDGVRRRVNYAALDAEEIGSVYESLLAFRPAIIDRDGAIRFDLVAQEGERRSTGSHYTPPEIVKEMIEHTLMPVVRERLAKAGPDRAAQAAALLNLRICDPACGSGHFLLEAARRLGRELARIKTGEEEPTPQAFRQAVRKVIRHCIYGVDKNPLAVELCKVALWIEGHTEGQPLSFLNHRIRCGDSLVGAIDLEAVAAGIPDAAYAPQNGDNRAVARALRDRNAEERIGQIGLAFEDLPPVREVVQGLAEDQQAVTYLPEDTAEAVRQKAAQFARGRAQDTAWWRAWTAANLWTAAFFTPRFRGSQVPTTHAVRSCLAGERVPKAMIDAANQKAAAMRFFHWPVEFPEVMREGGFDVILGNPPFLGGKRISTVFGHHYRHWLVTQIAGAKTNTADLCAFFFRRSFALLRPGGRMGLLATNTIAQGDTRQAGLDVICKEGGQIVWAWANRSWPGDAAVYIAQVVIVKGNASEPRFLNGRSVQTITPYLDDGSGGNRNPVRIHDGGAYIGCYVRGEGFILSPAEAEALIAQDPRNSDCLFPYLTGEDINQRPDHAPSRWVIDFQDWPLEKAKEYPDLLRIVEQRVKPQRLKVKQFAHRQYWWQFANRRPEMQAAVRSLPRVLVASRVTAHWAPVFFPTQPRTVFSEATVVFVLSTWAAFALLQSTVHELWARKYSSTMRSDLRYAPTDCFDTFPFPPEDAMASLAGIGETYYQHREAILQSRQIGLTECYNRFHDPENQDEDIVRLRELHRALDQAVAMAYGWTDLDLKHGFYPHRSIGEERYTLAPEQQDEVLRRLLDLNHAQAAARQVTAPRSPRRRRGMARR